MVAQTYGQHLPGASRVSRRGLQVVQAYTANPDAWRGGHQAQEKAIERVLRYPGGIERRIRYVAPDLERDALYYDPYVSFLEGEDPTRWEAYDVASLWSAPEVAPAQHQQGLAQVDSVPDTPGQLFERFTSPEYKCAQRHLWERVRNCYQVLEGSPWVSALPMFVIHMQQGEQDPGATYTLRTRVSQAAEEDELSKILKRQRPDGSALVSVDRLVDGVLAFEDERAAEEFGDMLEADGQCGVGLARCDSHQLFRMVGDASAVVVLCTAAVGQLPRPVELAVSLRGQRSLED